MKNATLGLLLLAGVAASGRFGWQTPSPDSQYRLGPDSMAQEGVPRGEVRGPFTLPSAVYPGTQHTYWVYVPAQYDPAVTRRPDGVSRTGRRSRTENGEICGRRT